MMHFAVSPVLRMSETAPTKEFSTRLQPSPKPQGDASVSRNALHVVGCVPMIPGAFAAKTILGLFAINAQHPATNETFIAAMDNVLRVTLVMGALGAGIAIPSLLLRAQNDSR